MTRSLTGVLALAWLSLASCNGPRKSEGEKLARTYCAACHEFPEPALLDKKTWLTGVLPQMAPRVGVHGKSLFDEMSRNPLMVVLPNAVSDKDWEKIVAYYRELAPDTLPPQSLPAPVTVDPDFLQDRAVRSADAKQRDHNAPEDRLGASTTIRRGGRKQQASDL